MDKEEGVLMRPQGTPGHYRGATPVTVANREFMRNKQVPKSVKVVDFT